METNNMYSQEPSIPPVQQTPEIHDSHQKRTLMIVVAIAMVIVLVAWYMIVKRGVLVQPILNDRQLSPEETLSSLEQTSQPVTLTPKAQQATLTALTKSSQKTTVSSEDRLQVLKALSK